MNFIINKKKNETKQINIENLNHYDQAHSLRLTLKSELIRDTLTHSSSTFISIMATSSSISRFSSTLLRNNHTVQLRSSTNLQLIFPKHLELNHKLITCRATRSSAVARATISEVVVVSSGVAEKGKEEGRALRVGLICGGPSAERGISLNSARSVLDHLQVHAISLS